VMKVKSAFNERRLADISTWYGGWFTDARTYNWDVWVDVP
jgi:hypothetical protein